MPKSIRSFIALDLSPTVRRQLGSLQRKLRPSLPEIQWVPASSIHLTLKFLGDVAETDIYEVCKAVKSIAEKFSPISFDIEGLGAFPHAERPRVLWAGIGDGTEELNELYESVEQLFREEFRFKNEERRFTPHLTLGRFKARSESIDNLIETNVAWEGGSVTARELMLYSSELGPKGPDYMVVGRGRFRR